MKVMIMNNDQMLLFKKIEGSRLVSFKIIYAEITGSLSAGVLLSQFIWWSINHSDENGYFQRTIPEITKYTSLTRHEQDAAKKKLISLGFIEKVSRGTPALTYFKVNHQSIIDYVLANGSPQTSLPNSGNLDKSNTYKEPDKPVEDQSIDISSMPNSGNLVCRNSERPMPNFGKLYIQDIQDSLSIEKDENSKPVDNFVPTPGAVVCMGWKKVGLIRVNPTHPNLLAALEAGITPEELIDIGKEAVETLDNPSMNWVIKTAIGRRNDAVKLAERLKNNPLPDKKLNAKNAYVEACEQGKKRLDGLDKWSHPAIFWAYKALGGDLQRFSEREIWGRWLSALDQAEMGVKNGSLSTTIPPFTNKKQVIEDENTDSAKPANQTIAELNKKYKLK